MDNGIKQKVKKFRRNFNIKKVTLEVLRSALCQQGYTIIEYNHIFNNEHVATLIHALQLETYCERTKGFTYADEKRRLVFLHEDLSYDEKLMILAHEEGHIYCNHFCSTPVLGKDVVEEHEANEFAHYLLHPAMIDNIGHFIYNHRKVAIPLVFALFLTLATCLIYKELQPGQLNYGKFHITSTGSKYHEKDCIFIKHKNNVERLTIEQFENNEYESCNICLPHGSHE